MPKRMMLVLCALAGVLALCHKVPAADGEVRIGIGAALNNNLPKRAEVKTEGSYRGQLVDASAVWHNALSSMDLQLGWTYIMESDFGTEQGVTLTLLGGDKFQYGAGIMLGYTQSYETWQKEYLNSDSYDAANPVGPRQCIFCGLTFQVGYEYKRAQVQLRYWRTDFNLYPGHNGALALITWRL